MNDENPAGQLDYVRVRILPDGRMTRRDAALYLGMRPKTLATWAVQGKGPPVIHVGRRAYYALEDLNQFIAAGGARSRGEGKSS